MNRQKVQANIFVAVMLGLGGAVLWKWQHNRAVATPAPPVRLGESPNGLRPADEKQQRAAHEAIEGQLKAFKSHDYARAMTYQSEGLRGRFPNPNSLRLMITHFYPAFANYRSATYGQMLSSLDGETILAPISVMGVNGVTVPAHYFLHRENGVYRVSGVDVGFYGPPRPFHGRPMPQSPTHTTPAQTGSKHDVETAQNY